MAMDGRGCDIAVVAVLLAAVTGCFSTPTPRYYTLDMRPSGETRPPVRLVVDRLRPSEALAREGILIQTSPTQIEYYAADQWAANLGELVTHKLEAEFADPADASRTVVVTGSILDFEQVDVPGGAEGYVRLALEFRDAGAGRYDPPLLEKTYEARVPAEAAAAEAVVRALSQGLKDVAAAIAKDAAAL